MRTLRFDSVFFLACFLPALTLLDLPLRGHERARRSLLLAAGLLFYAFSGPGGLVLMLGAALATYLFGLLLLLPRGRKAVIFCAVALDLGFLAAFKYLDFLLGGLLPGAAETLARLGAAAPAGVSFFTFKSISYLMDAYRDRARVLRNPLRLLLYISFFPQIMAGPITRAGDFDRLPAEGRDRGTDRAEGLRRFVLGLGKKLFLSGAAARVADAAFAPGTALDPRLAWAGAVAYSLQIYYDFSGYSDMALGLGRMFGFPAPENFNDPYAAASLTEFWRRWHISLSAWFRDYLYIPLGGSRRGRRRAAVNKLLVFALCGLWHGAAWTFVCWGLWHGLLAALETLGGDGLRRFLKHAPGRLLGHIWTLLAVCLGFVLFRAENLGQALTYLGAMLGAAPLSPAAGLTLAAALDGVTLLGLGLGLALCLPVSRLAPFRSLAEGRARGAGYALSFLLLLLCLTELAGGGFAPFIYFQF